MLDQIKECYSVIVDMFSALDMSIKEQRFRRQIELRG